MSDRELFGRDDRNEVIDGTVNEVRTPRVREMPDRDKYRSIGSALRVANDLVPRRLVAVLEVAHADVCDLGVRDHALIVRMVTASPPLAQRPLRPDLRCLSSSFGRAPRPPPP